MVKIALQIKAVLENVERLSSNPPTCSFHLKLKCTNCGESTDKWHYISESITVPSIRSETNFAMKCKLCSRENTIDIIPSTYGTYTSDDQGEFKTLVVFDCRGLVPIDFSPRDGWIVKVSESQTVFQDADLAQKDWVEFDERSMVSVGIYEFESQFIKVN